MKGARKPSSRRRSSVKNNEPKPSIRRFFECIPLSLRPRRWEAGCGSEIAAALAMNGKNVIKIFPETEIAALALPPDLSDSVTQFYRSKGVEVLTRKTLRRSCRRSRPPRSPSTRQSINHGRCGGARWRIRSAASNREQVERTLSRRNSCTTCARARYEASCCEMYGTRWRMPAPS